MLDYFSRKRRSERQDVAGFAALLTTPATAPFTLPAKGEFRLRTDAGAVLAGTLAMTAVGPSTRAFETPVLGEDGFYNIGRLERGTVVTLEPGFSLLLNVGLGVYRVVAVEA